MSRAKKRRLRRIIVIIIIVILLLLLGFGAYHFASRETSDAVTLCPHGGNYPRTAVLIDATDSLSESQIKAVIDNINSLPQRREDRGQIVRGEWVGVFVLNEDNRFLPEPTVALCYPGNKDTAKIMVENEHRIQRTYKQKFLRPMEEAVRRLAQTPEQPSSPIFEMISAVAMYGNFDTTQKRRLIIVSDMLQNVAAYSHYRDGVDYAKFRETPYARDLLQPSLLSGVTVEIWYLKRAGSPVRALQRSHVDFWQRYFRDVGAELAVFCPVGKCRQ